MLACNAYIVRLRREFVCKSDLYHVQHLQIRQENGDGGGADAHCQHKPKHQHKHEAAPESEGIRNRTFKAWVAVVEPDQREMPITTVVTERTAVPLAAPARVTMVIKVMIKFVL